MSQIDNRNQDSEVDILDIMRFCGRWIIKIALAIWNAFIDCIIYLIRKSPWLTAFVIIGVAISVTLYKTTPRTYESSAIVSSNNPGVSLVINRLENLNYLFAQQRYADVAALLSMDESNVKKIKSLTGYYGIVHGSDVGTNNLPAYYVKQYDVKDTSLRISQNYFRVKVLVYNEDVYPILAEGLLTYIANNSFALQANILRNEQVKDELANVDCDIANMQQVMASYKGDRVVMPSAGGSSQKSEIMQMQETLSRLYAHKNTLERQNILFTTPATIITDFSQTYRAVNTLLSYAIPAAIASFTIGLLLLVVWDNRKKLVQVVREHK